MFPQTIVITGASSGFGKGVARRLAAQGRNLVLVARRTQLLDELAAECKSALVVTADIGDPGAAERIGAAAQKRFGGFDAWINNAGVGAIGRFEDIPLADHLRVAQTNLLGTIAGSHVALVHFRARGHGTLVNIASLLGRLPAPYYASYAASKFGVVGLGAALRQELRADGVTDIHVCTVLPGAADTTFFEHAANYTGHRLQPVPIDDPEPVIDAIVTAVDTPRDEVVVGTGTSTALLAEQIAPGVMELATAAATKVTHLERPPEVPPTPGNLHAPVEDGRGVHGHVKDVLAAESGRASPH
jgi:short-subunit dehydrogenase